MERPPTPKWVKVLLIAVVVIAVFVGGVMLLAGGEHGPGRHMPGGDQHAPDDGGHVPPPGMPDHDG